MTVQPTALWPPAPPKLSDMEYVNLGRTGLKVTRICFGCMSFGTKPWQDWVLDEKAARPFFERAWAAGINFYDTADVYSFGTSEEILGRALRDLKIPREQVVIATKVNGIMGPGPNERGLSKKHILAAIDASLKRLQLDYVDLYQIHRFDPAVPVEETMEALNDIVQSGKALHIGASSMYAWQFAKMLHTADKYGYARFVTMQNHYNLVYREEEREMNPLCRDEGVGLIPWSPLARGFLTRKREETTIRKQSDRFGQNLYSDDDRSIVDAVSAIAEKHGVSNAEVALGWLLHQPGVVSPIVGVTKMDHLEAALRSVNLKLSDEDMKALNATYRLHPVLGQQLNAVRSAVIVFPGSNRDHDAMVALEGITGTRPQAVWYAETTLPALDLIVLPGGFSYGDYLRSGAIAARAPVMGAVAAAAARGVPVLGICNGFQILCETGLLPGVLMRNASLKFVCREVHLRVETAATVFTRRYVAGEVIRAPVAHGDGNYRCDRDMLARLKGEGRIAFRYVDAAGTQSADTNPNGSLDAIAGILSERRNVLGMMPHPENLIEPLHGGTDGRRLFQGVADGLAFAA